MNRLLLIPLLLGLGACASSSTPDNSTPPPPRPAKTIVVENPEASSVVRYPGRAEAVTSVDLAFRVGGPLIELPLKEGDRVEKGQILARIDPRDYHVRIRTLAAQAAAARAQRHKARLDRDRTEALVANDAAPKAQLDATQAGFRITSAQLQSAGRAVEAARLALKDTTLRAPFTGQVARIMVENHQTVAPGQPILRLQDGHRIEVLIDVPERDMLLLTTGKPPQLRVRFDRLGDQDFAAAVSEFDTDIDTDTQSYTVALTVETGELKVLPGMTATVAWHKSSGPLYPRVPLGAVQSNPDGTSSVWRVDPKSHTLTKLHVKLGQLHDNGIEVHAGIQPGDTLLAAGLSEASEGLAVQPLSTTMAQR